MTGEFCMKMKKYKNNNFAFMLADDDFYMIYNGERNIF